jgi:hypothetical protein
VNILVGKMGINDAELECYADGNHVKKYAAWEAVD